MTSKEIIDKLREDKHYYGEFGQQYLSNSNISTLLENPLALREPQKQIPAFLVGGYFHTAILEPEKLRSFKVIEASNRNTKVYKELSGGEMCLLQSEVDSINVMTDKLMSNKFCESLIVGSTMQYEEPGYTILEDNPWKGKADIINHDEHLIIDLKTTADIKKFRWSAKKYNYDSQAYIYRKIFGYDLIFMVIDKTTHQIGLYDCSDKFYETGAEKVKQASEVYDLFYKTEGFEPKQFFINQTL